MRPRDRVVFATAIVLLGLPLSGAANATFPGSNGRILFLSDRDGRGTGLWLTVRQGGPSERLKLSAHSASWSPDGRRIAFNTGVPGEEIFVVNANGSGLRRLTHNRVADVSPTWSPDGSQILFASRGGLHLMKADGTRRRSLRGTRRCAHEPAWSPDGTKIAFVDGCGDPTFPIYVMRSDGTDARQIGVGDNPSWSPDGSEIAFDTGYPRSIEVVRADGSARRTVTTGAEPAWSPDGQKIAFTRQEQSICDPQDRVTRILSISAGGTGETEITPRRGGRCEFRDSHPDWQPRCTRYGTKRKDRLVGTAGRDILCALATSDTVQALGGNDVVIGGDGKDAIYGGSGADWLFGSAGDDLIRARDGEPDIVNGGPGRDRARVDRGLDRVSGIERFLR